MALRITPKTNYYHSNGSGRDTYIIEDSGGFTIKKNSKPLIASSRFMKFGGYSKPPYSSNAKIIHYPPDGTGRDVYIGLKKKKNLKQKKNIYFIFFKREILFNIYYM
jgi:hypothetical protein